MSSYPSELGPRRASVNDAAAIPVFRFSTADLPVRDKFDAWRAQLEGLVDVEPISSEGRSCDASIDAALLGRVVIGKRTWTNPAQRMCLLFHRSSQKVLAAGHDHYFLQLQVSEIAQDRAGGRETLISPGQLFMHDATMPFDYTATLGTSIQVLLPRDLIVGDLRHAHGLVMSGALAGLLFDYIRALYGRLGELSLAEIPYATVATANILRACLQPTADTLAQAQSELDVLKRQRVKRYIDAHLFESDLGPEQICKAIGISRSSLYRLFESSIDIGVANIILQKRLRRARDYLADPTAMQVRVGEVARRHGFRSEKHFCEVFKAKFGYTAGVARERGLASDRPPPPPAQGTTISTWITSFLEQP